MTMIGGTVLLLTCGSLGYKYYLSPIIRKMDYERNSAFAELVFKEELQTKKAKDSG
jgi:hypothetical protein